MMIWAEPPPASHVTSDCEMVLLLRSAEAAHIETPLTITCGKSQVRASPEPTTFDRQTIMPIRLLLVIERKQRPELTI